MSTPGRPSRQRPTSASRKPKCSPPVQRAASWDVGAALLSSSLRMFHSLPRTNNRCVMSVYEVATQEAHE